MIVGCSIKVAYRILKPLHTAVHERTLLVVIRTDLVGPCVTTKLALKLSRTTTQTKGQL
jgi:hypothetical protein